MFSFSFFILYNHDWLLPPAPALVFKVEVLLIISVYFCLCLVNISVTVTKVLIAGWKKQEEGKNEKIRRMQCEVFFGCVCEGTDLRFRNGLQIIDVGFAEVMDCLLYTSPSPRD